MSLRRLQARIPKSELIDKCVLNGYALAFHKDSEKDGSGKCNIVVHEESIVYGALFEILECDLLVLDAYEGPGYDRKLIEVDLFSGGKILAHVYIANTIDPNIKPYTWYKHHVLAGAKELGLPLSYIEYIESFSAMPDSDTARSITELSIYEIS